MHGGAVALVLDNLTSLVISAVNHKGFWDLGHVSRTINCTYLRPAPINSKCIVECEIVHLGKGAGMLRGVIKNEKGQVLYTCEHGKVGFSSDSKL
jgi:acyl-coenzyme A thioesterase 13